MGCALLDQHIARIETVQLIFKRAFEIIRALS
jgi:hypothetical protein